jgi:hypothetical protein
VLFLIGSLLLIPGAPEFRTVGAFRDRRLGEVGTALVILGEIGWVVGTIVIPTNPEQEWEQPFTPLGAMLSSLGMILIGVSVIRAGVWTGWQRFVPIFTPAYYFLFVLPLR